MGGKILHLTHYLYSTHHGSDALRVEESGVDSVHSVIDIQLGLLLEENGPSVQTIVSPEDGETGFLISFHQSPDIYEIVNGAALLQ